ncbi:MAG: ribonuclease HII, partial [Marinobacter sp.]|nr:ribonuclease HII [Marinobacter sp.]
RWHWPSEPVIKGDSRVAAISAASIVAKVVRDREMVDLDRRFPGYGIAQHKGYPTPVHLEALLRLGATPEHRQSFRPVREAIEQVGLNPTDPPTGLSFPTDLFADTD